jgi:hypothetical protein
LLGCLKEVGRVREMVTVPFHSDSNVVTVNDLRKMREIEATGPGGC